MVVGEVVVEVGNMVTIVLEGGVDMACVVNVVIDEEVVIIVEI